MTFPGRRTDSETAINAIDTWVTQGVDALILLVQDTACENAALKAMEQGVLVVLGSATFSSYHVWCCQDYYNIGYNIAKMAAPDMKKNLATTPLTSFSAAPRPSSRTRRPTA